MHGYVTGIASIFYTELILTGKLSNILVLSLANHIVSV